ncbi:MAG: hypothetical protein C4523_07600, partial [Myxococcales bacterium]
MLRSPSPRIVYGALAVAVVSVSFAAIFFRKTAPTHPLVAAGLRLAVAAALLAPFVVRAALRGRLSRRALWTGALAGLCYGVHFGAWVTSLFLTSIAASVTLVTTTPIMLGIVGYLTGRDSPGKRFWLSLGLALLGLLTITGGDVGLRADASAGNLLALLGAVAMASYLLAAKQLGDRTSVLVFSGLATLFGAAWLLGAAAVAGV